MGPSDKRPSTTAIGFPEDAEAYVASLPAEEITQLGGVIEVAIPAPETEIDEQHPELKEHRKSIAEGFTKLSLHHLTNEEIRSLSAEEVGIYYQQYLEQKEILDQQLAELEAQRKLLGERAKDLGLANPATAPEAGDVDASEKVKKLRAQGKRVIESPLP